MIDLSEKPDSDFQIEVPSGDKVVNYLTSSIQRLNSRHKQFSNLVICPLNTQQRFVDRNIILGRCETSFLNKDSFKSKYSIDHYYGHKHNKETIAINNWAPCAETLALFTYHPSVNNISSMEETCLFFILKWSVTEVEKEVKLALSDFDEDVREEITPYVNVYYQYHIEVINQMNNYIWHSEEFSIGTNEQIESDMWSNVTGQLNMKIAMIGIYNVLEAEMNKVDVEAEKYSAMRDKLKAQKNKKSKSNKS